MISIADAKNRLPALIHQAEAGEAVTISRRGKAVAVVLSVDEYARLQRREGSVPSWLARLDGWRAHVPADLEGLREDELAAGGGELFAPRVDFGDSSYADIDAHVQALRAAEAAPADPVRRKAGKKSA
ncbi:type II toxin-antitoxin system Phd/YefM family antitoxin [Pseudothauera nasutitermitis]|uniref:Antitoxin n=1 Tax=Pseudothauera nasutitermitis TaxID=2565930 RepID=A0A4S4AVP6_9RHOO|nr:type II toxin-antitoxin system Phd/YefM family antitoxin [Pseudothauera nasutitermitis]THF64028.1 type II toxin-antitoxin system Phd/YefM family antitoxin [Pseudothauera nasutitermitis]